MKIAVIFFCLTILNVNLCYSFRMFSPESYRDAANEMRAAMFDIPNKPDFPVDENGPKVPDNAPVDVPEQIPEIPDQISKVQDQVPVPPGVAPMENKSSDKPSEEKPAKEPASDEDSDSDE